MERVRLHAGADRVGDKALDGGGDPGVIAGIPAGSTRGRGCAGQERGVQRFDALCAFPTPAATGGVKGAAAGKSEDGGKARPHARKDRAGTGAGLFGEVGE